MCTVCVLPGASVCVSERLAGLQGYFLLLSDKTVNTVATEDVRQSVVSDIHPRNPNNLTRGFFFFL